MYQKDNRFYADWRDRRGNRRRKAFLTAADASEYEERQKVAVRPKAEGAASASRKPSRRTSGRGSVPNKKLSGKTTSTRRALS
jgi:hypothetical protein